MLLAKSPPSEIPKRVYLSLYQAGLNLKRSIHFLKAVEPFYTELFKGLKTFEVRKNDRDFMPRDILVLLRYPYTGAFFVATVPYILSSDDFKGVTKGYCVMSLKIEYYEMTNNNNSQPSPPQPQTQPHYNGWVLYDGLMAKIKPLPNGNVATEHLRGDIIKRVGRLGLKDDPIAEIDKAIAQVQKLQDYSTDYSAVGGCNVDLDSCFSFCEYTEPPYEGSDAEFYRRVAHVLKSLPSGYSIHKFKDSLRHSIIIYAAIGDFGMALIALEKLKAEFTQPQSPVSQP